jgi:predicted GNAT family N-acyltransferase
MKKEKSIKKERIKELYLTNPIDLLERFRRLNIILGEQKCLYKKIDENLLEELYEIEYVLKEILSRNYSIRPPFMDLLK